MFSLALHGGAGTIARTALTPQLEAAYRAALTDALAVGTAVLGGGGAALDAVMATVSHLEDCPLFNAGRGAVFTHDGTHELDAALMTGADRRAGAVAGVTGVRNPIQLARLVMERSEHVLLAGVGAEAFARAQGAAFAGPDYFHVALRHQQWLEAKAAGRVQLDHGSGSLPASLPASLPDPARKMGTVGAVARDQYGHLAAATSTGGMTNKRWGRVGDTPLIGAGTWADDATCAVSCTGHGEFFIRYAVAYDIACLMEYRGLSLAEACRVVVHDKLVPVGGEGGLIAVDALGNVALPFNSEGMYRAWRTAAGEEGVAIY